VRRVLGSDGGIPSFAHRWYDRWMTKHQIAILLERAETWPQEAQEELIRSALAIERKHGGVYRLDDEERADIREGLAEIERGEVASEDEVQATFDDLRRA
jgi:predicted transcriptional regulator